MKSGERFSSLSGSGLRPADKHAFFYLKMKSLAMADLEVTPLIHLRPFYILPPPISRRKGRLICIRECSLPWHPLQLGGGGGCAQASPAGPGGARPPNIFCTFLTENEVSGNNGFDYIFSPALPVLPSHSSPNDHTRPFPTSPSHIVPLIPAREYSIP